MLQFLSFCTFAPEPFTCLHVQDNPSCVRSSTYSWLVCQCSILVVQIAFVL